MTRPTWRWLRVGAAALAGLCGALVAGPPASGDGGPTQVVVTVASTTITKSTFEHWLAIAERSLDASPAGAVAPLDPPGFAGCVAFHRRHDPKPPAGHRAQTRAQLAARCKAVYGAARSETLPFLISSDWLAAEAAEQGISISEAAVAMMLKKIEAAQFPSAAARHAFLAASGETPADLRYRVRIDYLSNRIRARVQDAPVTITPAQVMAYYVANTSRRKRPQRRDVRIVRVASAAQAAHVRALLASGRPLRLVAGRYSLDAASRKHGGLLIGVVRGDHARALDAAIFTAPVGRLVGPVKTPTGYDVFRVEKITPARTETLAEATPGITTLLTAQARDAALRTFVAAFNAKWTARTTCAPGYVVPDCANAPAAAPTTSALSLQAVAHVDASRASTHGGVRR